eukprot:scaffold72878_cov35-Tisochrysis_lutea.AAC.2
MPFGSISLCALQYTKLELSPDARNTREESLLAPIRKRKLEKSPKNFGERCSGSGQNAPKVAWPLSRNTNRHGARPNVRLQSRVKDAPSRVVLNNRRQDRR